MSGKSPAVLAALCQEGLALHRQGRLEEARRLYQKVLLRDPKHFDALFLLGTLTAQLGEAEPAAALLKRAVRANPRVAAAQSSLGATLNILERREEALASLDRAVALDPALPEAHFNRGLALAALGRREEAVAAFDAAIARAPGYAKAYHNRGAALHELKRYEEAIASFDRAAALQPHFAEALAHRGIALLEAKRPAEALRSFDAVLALDPAHIEAHANRGVALGDLFRHEEALAAHDAAIALDPDDPEPHSNRALALEELRRLDEAMEAHERAVALGPDNLSARVNRAFAYLLTGRFEEGWREYEWRKKKWPLAAHALDGGQPWRGEPLGPGERLFIYPEQGLGDAIQFCRFIPEIRARGIDLTFSVQRTLRPLLAQLAPGGEMMGDEPAGFARYCSIMSLPLALGVTADAIPSREGYLRADPERRARMEALIGERRRPRIGLAWSGNPANTKDVKRCIPFEALLPLLSFEADWFALQNEIRPADAATFQACGQVRFLGPELRDFGDTAALCEAMDLILSIDTSLAHLAGALGKPVWVLLPFVPDWRWMLGREDSPWYASARLFRQARPGDWAGVVAQATEALDQAGVAHRDRSQMLLSLARLHHERGWELQGLGRHEDSLAAYDAAIALDPADPQIHFNRAVALRGLNRWEEGLASYDRSLALDPAQPRALNNRASTLHDLGRFEEALASYDEALRLDPDRPEILMNRSLTLLLTGDLEAGWRDFENRKRFNPAVYAVDGGRPWMGQPPAPGERLFVRHEQGLGDTIQFFRYVKLLKARGLDVVLSVQASLASLLRAAAPDLEILTDAQPPARFDYHCAMMSLPLVFGTTLQTVPAEVPYLWADPGKAAAWADRLAGVSAPLKVGLVWAGNPRKHDAGLNAVDRRRSLTLEQLAPLADAGQIQFVSLQKGEPAAQARRPPPGLRLIDWADALRDFSDTAALVANLDLVITVDTSVAHLAGAMGKPVWILSRFDGCWRWLEGRDDSPWYPTARLFRQRAPLDWDEVAERVALELAALGR